MSFSEAMICGGVTQVGVPGFSEVKIDSRSVR